MSVEASVCLHFIHGAVRSVARCQSNPNSVSVFTFKANHYTFNGQNTCRTLEHSTDVIIKSCFFTRCWTWLQGFAPIQPLDHQWGPSLVLGVTVHLKGVETHFEESSFMMPLLHWFQSQMQNHSAGWWPSQPASASNICHYYSFQFR